MLTAASMVAALGVLAPGVTLVAVGALTASAEVVLVVVFTASPWVVLVLVFDAAVVLVVVLVDVDGLGSHDVPSDVEEPAIHTTTTTGYRTQEAWAMISCKGC